MGSLNRNGRAGRLAWDKFKGILLVEEFRERWSASIGSLHKAGSRAPPPPQKRVRVSFPAFLVFEV